MKTHRLNIILDKCSKKKFKNGFIQYLKSLDFEEFEVLFNHYNSVLTRLMFRYKEKNEKVRIFSKKWFRNENLKYKYDVINSLFYDSNMFFVEKINNKLENNNKRISELIIKVREINQSLEIIKNTNFSFGDVLNTKETINLITLLVEYTYNNNELKKVLAEIEELNK